MGTLVGHGAASFFTICLIASLMLSMSSSTSDAGRALYGISRAGMTIKQFGMLNRFHVPGAGDDAWTWSSTSLLVLRHQVQPGDPLHEQHRLRAGSRVRAQRLPAAAQATGPTGRDRSRSGSGWLPIAGFMCVLNFVFLRRRRPGAAAQRLRHLDRLLDRRRRARRLAVAVRLPARGPGRRERPHARGGAADARSAEEPAELGRSPRFRARRAIGVIKNIVIGYDETEPSQRALERAATLAKAFEAKLVVTSVAPVTTPGIGALHRDRPGRHRRRSPRRASRCPRLSGGRGGRPPTTSRRSATRPTRSWRLARERGADLIVVGTRELGTLQRLLGQSVSDAVSHGAHCDV